MTTVGAELLNEIERIVIVRERWKALCDRGPAAAMTITMLTVSIEAAKSAVTSGDVVACMQAYADLKGYEADV